MIGDRYGSAIVDFGYSKGYHRIGGHRAGAGTAPFGSAFRTRVGSIT